LKVALTSTRTTKSQTSIAKTRTGRQWRRQRTVRIVHAGLGLVEEAEEDVVLVAADAVDADAADLADAVVADHVAEAIVALAAAVVVVTNL